jgi:hypothetical protein
MIKLKARGNNYSAKYENKIYTNIHKVKSNQNFTWIGLNKKFNKYETKSKLVLFNKKEK